MGVYNIRNATPNRVLFDNKCRRKFNRNNRSILIPMKKLILIFGIVFSVFLADAQIKGYTVEATEYLIISGDTLGATTQLTGADTIAATKDYVLSVAGAGNGWDSIIYQPDDGYLVWWYAGARIDSTSTDGRDVMYTDSTDIFYTQRTVDSLITASGAQTVYAITLPIAGTLSGSVALMVEGTDYPTGWVIAASGGDLQVNHGLGRYTANTTIKYNTTGSTYRQLRNFDNAYSGVLDVDNNNVTIESISTFYTAYKLKIHILFE